ncbi:MAG: hypothetical protein HY717_15455 [Planctomycetes bacterium]|nr:hypothetical protein [Planctomycetota bacterium]
MLHSLLLGDFQIACRDAADFDDSGEVDISDPINSLLFQFTGGSPAPPPGSAACGEDLTADQDPNHPGGDLGCDA